MKPGDTIEKDGTRLAVIESEGDNVRLRYLTPHALPPMREWYAVEELLYAGWRVIPAVEVPPCMDV